MSHSCSAASPPWFLLSKSNHNLSCKCCDPRICIFVFHQGQDREKLKLNRKWISMFPKRCPNQFAVPSTSSHSNFQQQGHQTKNGKTSKGWNPSLIIVFPTLLPLNRSIFVPHIALCNSPTECTPSDIGFSGGGSMYIPGNFAIDKAFLMSSKSVCDNRLASFSLTRTRRQQKKSCSQWLNRIKIFFCST